MTYSWKLQNKRIWIAGHEGMVGRAVMRRLDGEPCACITAPRRAPDLRRQADVEEWLAGHMPDAVIIAAATAGGIGDNKARPADFLYDNLMIAANIIEASHRCGIDRLLYLGSSCIYPRDAAQPIREEALLSGPLETTNEAYAIAKIAGMKLCEAYRTQHGRSYIAAMPCNLYGPYDRFDFGRSHVIPALIMKMHKAKEDHAPTVTLWGTGAPLREFLHVDDLANALVGMLTDYDGASHLNIGSGEEISIADLAFTVAKVVGYEGTVLFDPAMPDGTPRKLIDSRKIRALGWKPAIKLEKGLEDACRWYVENRGDYGAV